MNKTELIEKLIKEGKITFVEALILNTTEKEYIYLPSYTPAQIQPYISFPSTYCTASNSTTVDASFAYKNKNNG